MVIIETISFSDALKFPFKKPKRLLYGLMVLIPILGWFVLFGYIARLINEFVEGRYEGLIKLDIIEDLKLGFVIFLKALPFFIILLIVQYAISQVNETLGLLVSLLLSLFVRPILEINFYRKQTIKSFFEFGTLHVVKDDFGDYIITILKQIALGIVFLILSLVLIGIPAFLFTQVIFIANFYGRVVEQKNLPALEPQFNEPSTDQMSIN
ncbi:MAG: hypothetical protein QG610_1996 [Euryarchaeota archaeon]|nr:hypothetical protein [Euryarchaeota archaeon]